MKEIIKYLSNKPNTRNFKTGVELVIKHDSTISVNKTKFLREEAVKEEPSRLAVQMVESSLRHVLRIESQNSKKKEADKKYNSMNTDKTTNKEKTQDQQTNKEKIPEEPSKTINKKSK